MREGACVLDLGDGLKKTSVCESANQRKAHVLAKCRAVYIRESCFTQRSFLRLWIPLPDALSYVTHGGVIPANALHKTSTQPRGCRL